MEMMNMNYDLESYSLRGSDLFRAAKYRIEEATSGDGLYARANRLALRDRGLIFQGINLMRDEANNRFTLEYLDGYGLGNLNDLLWELDHGFRDPGYLEEVEDEILVETLLGRGLEPHQVTWLIANHGDDVRGMADPDTCEYQFPEPELLETELLPAARQVSPPTEL